MIGRELVPFIVAMAISTGISSILNAKYGISDKLWKLLNVKKRLYQFLIYLLSVAVLFLLIGLAANAIGITEPLKSIIDGVALGLLVGFSTSDTGKRK